MKIVISLGGSVIIPERVDYKFLLDFKKLIKRNLKKHKFTIVTGGGRTARIYRDGGKKLRLRDNELDWLGIAATRMNALLLKFVFGKLSRKIKITGGTRPGHTTDYVCSILAKEMKADYLVNISNVTGVYDKDPTKYKNAKMFKKLDLKKFYNLFGKGKFKPGQNVIFDQKATRSCLKNRIKLIFISKDLKNFQKFLSGKKFLGTIVE